MDISFMEAVVGFGVILGMLAVAAALKTSSQILDAMEDKEEGEQ